MPVTQIQFIGEGLGPQRELARFLKGSVAYTPKTINHIFPEQLLLPSLKYDREILHSSSVLENSKNLCNQLAVNIFRGDWDQSG